MTGFILNEWIIFPIEKKLLDLNNDVDFIASYILLAFTTWICIYDNTCKLYKIFKVTAIMLILANKDILEDKPCELKKEGAW